LFFEKNVTFLRRDEEKNWIATDFVRFTDFFNFMQNNEASFLITKGIYLKNLKTLIENSL